LNYVDGHAFGSKKNKSITELAESHGSAHKPRKKKAQHDKEEMSQSTTHFKASKKINDNFGQNVVASALAEANLASDQLYHDEGDIPGKGTSHHLFSSPHQ
jgi:hypothetical protein